MGIPNTPISVSPNLVLAITLQSEHHILFREHWAKWRSYLTQGHTTGTQTQESPALEATLSVLHQTIWIFCQLLVMWPDLCALFI